MLEFERIKYSRGSLLLVFSGFAFVGLRTIVGIRMLPSLSLSVEFLDALLVLANCLWIALTIFNGIFAIKLYSGKEKYRIPEGILGGINFSFFIFVIIFSAIKKIGVSLIAINIISDIITTAFFLGFFFTLDYKKNKK